MPTSNDPTYTRIHTGAHVRTYAASVNFARVRSPSRFHRGAPLRSLYSDARAARYQFFSVERIADDRTSTDSIERGSLVRKARNEVSSFVGSFVRASRNRFANGGRREADGRRHVVRHVAKGVIRRGATFRQPLRSIITRGN